MNKMKIHNAAQSLDALRHKAEILIAKMDAHVAANGLHQPMFSQAMTYLDCASEFMRKAVKELRP